MVLARALFKTTSQELALLIAEKAINGTARRQEVVVFGSVRSLCHNADISTDIFPAVELKNISSSRNAYDRRAHATVEKE